MKGLNLPKSNSRAPSWTCLAIGSGIILSLTLFTPEVSHAFVGEDIPYLIEIIAKSVEEVESLETIIGATQQTASILDEMNQGVKQVLRIADTAHLPLPEQVYINARAIDQAYQMARDLYGDLPDNTPTSTVDQYKSGVESLQLSQDAFDYATSIDQVGRDIKSASLSANTSAATKLTAEGVGVLLQVADHGNRIQAKNLELQSTRQIEESSSENNRYQSFEQAHDSVEKDLGAPAFGDLNSLSGSTDQ